MIDVIKDSIACNTVATNTYFECCSLIINNFARIKLKTLEAMIKT